MTNSRTAHIRTIQRHLRAKGIRKARVNVGSTGADRNGNATGWYGQVSHQLFGKCGATQKEIRAALADFPGALDFKVSEFRVIFDFPAAEGDS